MSAGLALVSRQVRGHGYLQQPTVATRQAAIHDRHTLDDPPTTSDSLDFSEPYDPHRVYKAFVASVARLGLKPQPLRMLRHLAASLLIAAGVDIAIVSKRLGHSKIDLTVDTYGHLIGKGGRKAANAAARLVPRGNANAKKDKPKKGKKKDKQDKSSENGTAS